MLRKKWKQDKGYCSIFDKRKIYKKAVDSYNMSRGNKSKDFESQVNETHFKPQMRRVVLNKNRPQTCIDRHYNSASLMYNQPQNKKQCL